MLGRSHRSSGASRRRLGPVIVLVGLVVLLAGCRTEVSTVVEVHPDGSGRVSTYVVLDAEAAAKVGDLSEALDLDDLKRAGWTVEGPLPFDELARRSGVDADFLGLPQVPTDGLVALRLRHGFRNVKEANAVLATLSGPRGPYRDLRIERSTSFASTDIEATGTVDLTGGLDAMGDEALTKALGGRTVSDLAGGLGAPALGAANGGVHLRFEGRGLALEQDRGSGTVIAATRFGGRPDTVALHGSRSHTTALLLAALAVLALLGAAGVFVFQHLPGRNVPPPASVTRQRHSARHGWDLVQRRRGVEVPAGADRAPAAGRRGGRRFPGRTRGRHARPRGGDRSV